MIRFVGWDGLRAWLGWGPARRRGCLGSNESRALEVPEVENYADTFRAQQC